MTHASVSRPSLQEVPVAAVAFDEAGSIVDASARFASMLGREPSALPGTRLWDVVAGGQSNRVVNEILQGRVGFELDLRGPDGATIAARAVGVSHAAGRFELWLAAATGEASDAEATARALRSQNAILLGLAKVDAIDAGRLDEAFAHITEAASSGLGCARASVWLYDAEQTSIVCHDLYAIADGSHGAKGFTLTAKDYPAYFAALAEDRTIAADDCRKHPATREFTDGYLVPLGITSMLEAPIRRVGKLIGVLCNEHVGPVRSFGQEEQNFAANVADYVTRALEASARREASEALATAHAALERHAAELELRVAERTQAIQLVLDSTGEGLLTCTLDGALSAESSAIVREWFGPAAPGATAQDYVFADAAARATFASALEQVADDVLPFELAAEQLPREVRRGDRTFRIGYRPVAAGAEQARLLMIVRDATAEVLAERAQRDARELHAVGAHVLRDRTAFVAFVAECGAIARALRAPKDATEARRGLHTLKGNCAIHGLESVADAAHRAEDRLAEDPSALGEACAAAATAWEEARARIEAVFGSASDTSIRIDEGEFERFLGAMIAAEVRRDLVETARSWRAIPTQAILERLARQVERVGKRVEKDVAVVVEDPGLRVPRQDMGPFFAALIHVVRNAVDHGIEDASERLARGKPARGEVRLAVARDDDRFEVRIADDGRGIDWTAVSARATRLGLPAGSRAELEDALFADGLSTRDEVTDLSGRGVGLGAVRAAIRDLGGSVSVDSAIGRGTTFRFVFPLATPLRAAA